MDTHHVIEADRVYSMLEDWFKNKEIVKTLEEYINSVSWSCRCKLNIPATIASYFLFYMVTIKSEYEKMNKSDYILNINLITEFIKQSELKDIIQNLNNHDTIRTLVECGMNVHVGFVWDKTEIK